MSEEEKKILVNKEPGKITKKKGKKKSNPYEWKDSLPPKIFLIKKEKKNS